MLLQKQRTAIALVALAIVAISVFACGAPSFSLPQSPPTAATRPSAAALPTATRITTAVTTPGSAIPTPTAVPVQDTMPWLRQRTDGAWTISTEPESVTISVALPGDPALMAGTLGNVFEGGSAAVWTLAPAGAAVERLPTADPTLSSAIPYAGARSINRVVLVGRTDAVRCAHPDGVAIWVRADDLWAAKPFEQEDCTRIPSALAGGPAGFVAVTSAMEIYGVWRSVDGLAWKEVTPRDATNAQLFDGIFAAGHYLVAGRDGEAWAVWSSTDATTWKRIAVPRGAGIASLAGTDRVALAWRGDGQPLLRTTDGTEWEPIAAAPPSVGEHGALVQSGGGFFLSGATEDEDGTLHDPVLWASADGNSWQPIPLPAGAPADLSIIARVGSQVLIAGAMPDGTGRIVITTAWPFP